VDIFHPENELYREDILIEKGEKIVYIDNE